MKKVFGNFGCFFPPRHIPSASKNCHEPQSSSLGRAALDGRFPSRPVRSAGSGGFRHYRRRLHGPFNGRLVAHLCSRAVRPCPRVCFAPGPRHRPHRPHPPPPTPSPQPPPPCPPPP